MIEVVATGGLFWAPLMAAILSAIVQQTNDEKRQFIREEVDRAVAIARTEALKRTPVTPAEPSQWLGMALTSVWDQYFAALVMHENLQSWQAKVQNAAPPGWSLELVSMSLGKEGPKLSNWQCFSSPDGRLLAVECKMEFISDTVKVVVKGSGPLGAFGATVSSLSVSGNIKLIPRPDQRIVLWAFKEPPSVLFKLQLSSGLSNAYDVPSFGFLRNALTDSIKSTMVEPRRAAISLDYEYLVQQALDTTITVFIESVQNLFPSPLSKPVVRPSSEDVAVWDSSDDEAVYGVIVDPLDMAKKPIPAFKTIQIVATNLDTNLKRRTAAKSISGSRSIVSSINSVLKLSLGDKEGLIKIDIVDCSKDSRPILGSCLVHAAATKDGRTLFWAVGRDGDPLALRWQPGLGPWKITLPLEGSVSPKASITIQLSADPWIYQTSSLASMGTDLSTRPYRTLGPRAIILQVLEARDLAPSVWTRSSASSPPSCDPYAIIKYNNKSVRTPTLYNTTQPVWNRSFVFAESQSQMARRMKIELWDSGVSRDESLGSVNLNLDLALENTIQDRWVQLVGEESGELRVRLTAVPGDPSSPMVQSMLDLFDSALSKSSTPSLQVVVLMARNLPLKEDRPSGHYVNVVLAGTRQVSPFIRQSSSSSSSSSPTFNFACIFPFSLSKLRIELKDVDSLIPDEDIGHCLLDIGALTPQSGMSWEEWVPLKKDSRWQETYNGAEILIRLTHLEPSPSVAGLSSLPIPSNLLPTTSSASSGSESASAASSDSGKIRRKRELVDDSVDEGDELDPRRRLPSPTDLMSSGASQLIAGLGRQIEITRDAGSDLRVKLVQDWVPKVSDWWKSTYEGVVKPKAEAEESKPEPAVEEDMPKAKAEVKEAVAEDPEAPKQPSQQKSSSSLFGFSLAWPFGSSSLPATPPLPPLPLPQKLTIPLDILSADQLAKIREQVPDVLKAGPQGMTGLAKTIELNLTTLSQSSRNLILSVLPLSVLSYQEDGKTEGQKALPEASTLASYPLPSSGLNLSSELEEEEEEEEVEEPMVSSVEAVATIDVEEETKAELEISLDWGVDALSSFEEILPKIEARSGRPPP